MLALSERPSVLPFVLKGPPGTAQHSHIIRERKPGSLVNREFRNAHISAKSYKSHDLLELKSYECLLYWLHDVTILYASVHYLKNTL